LAPNNEKCFIEELDPDHPSNLPHIIKLHDLFQGVKQLKVICHELEEQVLDYEILLKKSEEKEVQWITEK